MRLRSRPSLWMLGALIGVLLSFSPGTVFVFTLAALTGYAVYRMVDPADRRFLVVVFAAGFLMRVCLSLAQDGLALMIYPGANIKEVNVVYPKNDDYTNLIVERTRTFYRVPDSDYNSARGYVYTAFVKGNENIVVRHYLLHGLEYGWHGYLYVIGLFYYLFGYSPIAVKFVNCLIGSVQPILMYKMCFGFDRPAARATSVLCMFFPSLMIWSTTNLKDTSLLLLFTCMVLGISKFLQTFKKRYLALGLAAVCMQIFLTRRDWFYLSVTFMISAVLVNYVIVLIKGRRRLALTLFILLSTICVIIAFRDLHLGRKIVLPFIRHIGHVNTPGISYRILGENYYSSPDRLYAMPFPEFMFSSLRGVFHFIFEPLPWRFLIPGFIVALPQAVIWYVLVFFMFLGIVKIQCSRIRVPSTVVIFMVLYTWLIAVSSGNIGTTMRHRDLLMPFYLMFSAVGIVQYFGDSNSGSNYKQGGNDAVVL